MKKKPLVPPRPEGRCFRCRNFFLTYRFPLSYGCRAYGFVSQRLPSLVVFEASGGRCLLEKPMPPADAEARHPPAAEELDGWLA